MGFIWGMECKMMQSWIIYSISTGQIICYGKQIDVDGDQQKIDQGNTSCTLYMIQQICNNNIDYTYMFSDCGAVDPLSTMLCEVDHDAQALIDMPLNDIKAECKRLSNNDIVDRFAVMKNVKDCVERLQGAIPQEAVIGLAINTWMDDLEIAKGTVDNQISNLATQIEALQYYGSRAWLSAFPPPVSWEDM
jgi:hypothetical protein